MKRKTVLISFAIILALAFCAGYSGLAALPVPENSSENGGADRLIGIFVTQEPLDLFDFDAYFEENASKIFSGGEIDAKDTQKYGGKLHAVLRSSPYYNEDGTPAGSRKEYVFEGVDGLLLAAPRIGEGEDSYIYFHADDGVSDSDFHLKSTNAGDDVELSAVIYASASGGTSSFYPNPVYQTASGEVYAVAGSGSSYLTPTPGQSSTFTLSENQSVSADGQTSASASSVELKIEFIAPPERTALMQYSADGEMLSSLDLTPDDVPESITPEPGCAYMVTSALSGGEPEYGLFAQDDDLWIFRPLGDTGIYEKRSIAVEW